MLIRMCVLCNINQNYNRANTTSVIITSSSKTVKCKSNYSAIFRFKYHNSGYLPSSCIFFNLIFQYNFQPGWRTCATVSRQYKAVNLKEWFFIPEFSSYNNIPQSVCHARTSAIYDNLMALENGSPPIDIYIVAVKCQRSHTQTESLGQQLMGCGVVLWSIAALNAGLLCLTSTFNNLVNLTRTTGTFSSSLILVYLFPRPLRRNWNVHGLKIPPLVLRSRAGIRLVVDLGIETSLV
jgi:hypothetical protein